MTTYPHRTNRPAAATVRPRPDQIDRDAVHVRLPSPHRTVHILAGREYDPARGHIYLTRCKGRMCADEGAMLTTWDATCERCKT